MPGIFSISVKTKLYIASILLSLILIAGCVSPPVPSSNNTAAQDTIRSTRVLNATNGSYSVNATVPVVTGTLMVYTLEKPNYSKEWVSSLAEKLRMSGDVREGEGSFLANISDEKKFYFYVEKDVKRISYIQKGGFSSGNMTEAEAVAFAQEFLKSVDLMPDATEPRVAYNTAETFSRSSGQASQSLKEAVVVFNRRINGLPAWGSSSMITVGPNGNIVSLFIFWPDYQPYKTVSLISPDQAFNEFQTRKLDFSYYEPSISPEKIEVTAITLGYSTSGGKYYRPVYLFKGYGQQGNETREFLTEIPATDENFE